MYNGRTYRAFSLDVTAAILVFQNNKTAAMLVYRTNPEGVELSLLCKRFLLFQYICIDAGHVSENALLIKMLAISGVV